MAGALRYFAESIGLDVIASKLGGALPEYRIDLGICLHSPQYDELCDNPPDNIVSFTDAVFLADGMNPAAVCQML